MNDASLKSVSPSDLARAGRVDITPTTTITVCAYGSSENHAYDAPVRGVMTTCIQSNQVSTCTYGYDSAWGMDGCFRVGRDSYGSYVDEPLLYVNGSAKYYPHSNHLYSVAALTDAAGVVVERYRYDAYGKRTVLNAAGTTVLPGSTVGFQRGFTGYYLDQETGLYYARARMYSAGLGRFVGRDNYSRIVWDNMVVPSAMAGYQNGFSLYKAYFVPNSTDPNGHEVNPPQTIAPPLTPLGEATASAIWNTLIPECQPCCTSCTVEECKREAWEIAQKIVAADAPFISVLLPGGDVGNIINSLTFGGVGGGCSDYASAEFAALESIGAMKCWAYEYRRIVSALIPSLTLHRFIRITNICTGSEFDSRSWNLAWPDYQRVSTGPGGCNAHGGQGHVK